MQHLRALLLATVILTAGCIGGASGPATQTTTDVPETSSPADSKTTDRGTATPSETATPTPTPTATATPDELSGQVAPGVTASGLRNASALLEAHTDALQRRGFEVAVERNVSLDGQSANVTWELTGLPGFERFRYTATSAVAGNRTTRHGWANATMERMLVRVTDGDRTRYRIPPIGAAADGSRVMRAQWFTKTRQLAQLLRGGEFEVRSASADGRYTLVGENFSTHGYYGEREVHLIVGERGVVHALKAAGELSDGGSFTFGYRVRKLGVDEVARPDWVGPAPEPLDTRPTVGVENCSTPYLTLENPGPDALPAGTTVSVRSNGTEYEASLDDRLAAGARRALYLSESGDLRVTSVDSVPENRAGLSTDISFTVTAEKMLLTDGGIGFGCSSAGTETPTPTEG